MALVLLRLSRMRNVILLLLLLTGLGKANAQGGEVSIITFDTALDLFDKGDYDGAIAFYNDFLAKSPDNGYALYNRALCWGAKKRPNQALRDLNRCLKNMPEHAKGFHARGVTKQQLRDFKGAMLDYDRAIALKGRKEFYESRANLNLRQKRLDAAASDYESGYNAKKPKVIYIQNWSNALLQQQKYAEANMVLKGGLEHFPKNSSLFYQLAGSYFMLKDYEQSAVNYSQAIAIKPKFLEAEFYRAQCYNQTGNIDAAIQGYTRVIELDPNNAEAYYFRGLTYTSVDDLMRGCVDINNAKVMGSKKAAEAYDLYCKDLFDGTPGFSSPEGGINDK